jgi:hypothetical protein
MLLYARLVLFLLGAAERYSTPIGPSLLRLRFRLLSVVFRVRVIARADPGVT